MHLSYMYFAKVCLDFYLFSLFYFSDWFDSVETDSRKKNN